MKEFCHNRLPAAYLPETSQTVQWLRFLDDLLEPEDIPALQEFFGYALLPVTKAQKMLNLIGKGKARVGLLLRSLLGENMNTGSIQKVETDLFARADLEYKLLMVDDDLRIEVLTETHRHRAQGCSEHPRRAVGAVRLWQWHIPRPLRPFQQLLSPSIADYR